MIPNTPKKTENSRKINLNQIKIKLNYKDGAQFVMKF